MGQWIGVIVRAFDGMPCGICSGSMHSVTAMAFRSCDRLSLLQQLKNQWKHNLERDIWRDYVSFVRSGRSAEIDRWIEMYSNLSC